MPPRIRSLAPRPVYAREIKSPAPKAPTVFREFVETLQQLDPPAAARAHAPRLHGRKRGYAGNGHKRPGRAAEGAGAAKLKLSRRTRSRTQ